MSVRLARSIIGGGHVTGSGCNCGAVRYEVTAPLVAASYCHCKRCQRRSGAAASPSAHPAPGTFRIVAGEDRLRMWKPEDGGEKWFCGDCGSALFARNTAHADPIGIRMLRRDIEQRIEAFSRGCADPEVLTVAREMAARWQTELA